VRVSCVGNVFFDVGNADFTITAGQPPPVLSSILPAAGTPLGGTPVALTGTGFASGATVLFDGIPAASVVWHGPTSISAETPAHAAGAVNVTVTNPDAQGSTLSSGYTYDPDAPDLPFADGFEDGALDGWSDSAP
jgi:hypothetical protein